VTQDEMISAMMPYHMRDYCAHHLLEYKGCQREKFPRVQLCEHIRRKWQHCRDDMQIDRMKDYEREKRLMRRKYRIAQKKKFLEEKAAKEAAQENLHT